VPILYYPFVEDIRAGRIRVVGPVRKISGQNIHVFHSIEAQSREQAKELALSVDAVVAGTGFRTGLSDLVKVLGITTRMTGQWFLVTRNSRRRRAFI
jgi:putative flavoprotein involved in K+ transport